MHERVAGQHQLMVTDQLEEAFLAPVDGAAVRIQRFGCGCINQRLSRTTRGRMPRQKHAAFLECLTDRRHTGREISTACITVTERDPVFGGVFLMGLAAGKDQRAGGKIDLVMPLDHQHLQIRRVAQQEDCRG